MMKAKSFLPLAAMAAMAMFTACSDDMENFDNKVYVDASHEVPAVLTGLEDTDVQTVTCTLAQPAVGDVQVTFAADESLVKAYNAIYSGKAEMLPAENYTLANDGVVTVSNGGVQSEPLEITFKGLATLERSKTYVLPVRIVNAPVEVLASEGVKYFEVRAGALVNVAPNLSNHYLAWQNEEIDATGLDGMTEITVEALLYPTNLTGEGHDANISTIMGVEGRFLIRIGDASVDPAQIQIATSAGNMTDASWKLPQDEWTALAVTYDTATGVAKVYFNGVQKGSDQRGSYSSTINWFNTGGDPFYIGKSYSDTRHFDGLMSEVRVWNKVLTPDDFKQENHFYKVDPASPGLVSYWKMNEGAGVIIEDYANGYNLMAQNVDDDNPFKWQSVQLPPVE